MELPNHEQEILRGIRESRLLRFQGRNVELFAKDSKGRKKVIHERF